VVPAGEGRKHACLYPPGTTSHSLAAKGCDLLHIPHYNAPLLHRGPLLVSILDLIHITDPVYSRSVRSWVYARPMLNLVARKAQHIVTLSEYSKAQIVERLGVPAEKVTAIYCGVNGKFRCADREEAYTAASEALGIQEPYILFVGSLKPHKNISTLLQAYMLLRRRQDIRQRLLIVGDDARWKSLLVEECSRLGIQDATTFVPYVSQELLPKVYAGADLLVMPSTIEGLRITRVGGDGERNSRGLFASSFSAGSSRRCGTLFLTPRARKSWRRTWKSS